MLKSNRNAVDAAPRVALRLRSDFSPALARTNLAEKLGGKFGVETLSAPPRRR
jgi:hypothetical protein